MCHAARAPSADVLTITVLSTFYPAEARSSNLSQSLKFLQTEKTTADPQQHLPGSVLTDGRALCHLDLNAL